MGRKKAAVVQAQPVPVSLEVKPVDSMPTPSGSFSSTTTNPTCPHCRSVFTDMSITDFRDHVAGCTRPSTAEDGSSSSSLSSPPLSPSELDSVPVSTSLADATQEIAAPSPSGPEPVIAEKLPESDVKPDVDEDPIRPYLDPEMEFEYYDQAEPAGELEVEAKDPDLSEIPENEDSEYIGEPLKIDATFESSSEPIEVIENIDTSESPAKLIAVRKPATKKIEIQKFGFPKFTPVEVFEDYLNDPESMEYDELYKRTSKTSECLLAWQKEWEINEREILAHEAVLRSEAKRAEDEARELLEEQRLIDDATRDKLAEIYKRQLKMKTGDWKAWLKVFEQNPRSDRTTIDLLKQLKDPNFMSGINKKKRLPKNKDDRLENVPYPELKPSKEDIANEKRKRGRLMDPVRFDDIKMADAYGLEYSAHIKHYGAQPLPDPSRRSQFKTQATATNGDNSGGLETNEGRTRVQRNRTKRLYEAELSVSPESDEDRLPAKRARRSKMFEDGIESSGRSRGTPYSRSGTPPAVKVFPSGKRVGRPPARSKLQAVQMAPRSESPESPLRMTPGGTLIIRNSEGNIERTLPPYEQAQLHDAAESLVNKAVSDNAIPVTPVKKKHAGGRPRKVVPGGPPHGGIISQDLSAPPKPKNKGGRPRKNRDVDPALSIKTEATPQDDGTVLQSTEQIEVSQELGDFDGRRAKRKRTSADSDQSPIVVDPSLFYGTDPLSKKRRTRAPRDEDDELDSQDPFGVGESTAPGSPEQNPNPKNRKSRGPRRDMLVEEAEAEDSDAGIDESLLDPAAREALRLKRVKKEKSRKLSESMKARWANGGMKEAQETRKVNNAAKKAAKQAGMAEAQALGIPYVAPIDSPTTGTPIIANTSVPKIKAPRSKVRKDGVRKSKASQPRNARPRKTVRGRVVDDEEEEELEKQLQSEQQSERFKSEYDHYQALTSPKSPYPLGKRVRKSLVDLKQAAAYGSDESDDFGRESEEDDDDEVY